MSLTNFRLTTLELIAQMAPRKGTTSQAAEKLNWRVVLYQGASGEPTRWVGRAPQTQQNQCGALAPAVLLIWSSLFRSSFMPEPIPLRHQASMPRPRPPSGRAARIFPNVVKTEQTPFRAQCIIGLRIPLGNHRGGQEQQTILLFCTFCPHGQPASWVWRIPCVSRSGHCVIICYPVP